MDFAANCSGEFGQLIQFIIGYHVVYHCSSWVIHVPSLVVVQARPVPGEVLGNFGSGLGSAGPCERCLRTPGAGTFCAWPTGGRTLKDPCHYGPSVVTAGPLRWFPHPAPPADGAEAPPRPCWQRAGSPRCHPPRAQWKWSEWRPRTRCRTRSRSPAHPCWTPSPTWMSLEVRLWRWTWTTTVLEVLKTL